MARNARIASPLTRAASARLKPLLRLRRAALWCRRARSWDLRGGASLGGGGLTSCGCGGASTACISLVPDLLSLRRRTRRGGGACSLTSITITVMLSLPPASRAAARRPCAVPSGSSGESSRSSEILVSGTMSERPSEHSSTRSPASMGSTVVSTASSSSAPRALGADEDVAVDTTVLPIEAGDRVLLCSDGLSDMVPETRISELLLDSPEDPERAARGLLAPALHAGGNDNITVIVVDVKEQAPPPRRVRSRSAGHSGTSEMRAVEPQVQPQEGRTPPVESPRRAQDR